MAAEQKDYYRVLGVDRRADEREIKAAFRRLARRYHPDVNPGDSVAERQFKDVNEAYEVLSDTDKRRRYDVMGPVNWARSVRTSSGARTTETGASTFDFFQNVFNNANVRRARGKNGRDIEQDVTVTLEEAYGGSARVFSVQGEEHCERCDGSGRGPSGRPCPACAGSGLVSYSRKIEVAVPMGVRDGSRIRLAGEGGAGVLGGAKGDLYFRVHVQPHDVFRREEDDLLVDLDVAFTTLVLGGEIEVATLSRPVRMKVPATTLSGRQFRLARQGMPRLGGGGTGDLIVRVNASLPRQISDRERRLFEELQELSMPAQTAPPNRATPTS